MTKKSVENQTPRVRLAPFSVAHAFGQADALRYLVQRDADFYRTYEPGTLHRYGRDLARGAYHVARVATSSEVHAFLIKVNERTRGIGTIIANQTVHYGGQSLTANDLDYRMHVHTEINWAVHQAVGQKLMALSHQLDPTSESAAMLITPTDLPQDHLPVGLVAALGPNSLKLRHVVLDPTGESDRDDVARSGETVNVYATTDFAST